MVEAQTCALAVGRAVCTALPEKNKDRDCVKEGQELAVRRPVRDGCTAVRVGGMVDMPEEVLEWQTVAVPSTVAVE